MFYITKFYKNSNKPGVAYINGIFAFLLIIKR